MAEYLANVFLETFRTLLVEEAKYLLGVGDDVEKVEANLKSIHALLMKADSRRDSPTLIQLKRLAFNAENLLETYAVKVQCKREGLTLTDRFQRYICIICECFSAHEVRKEAGYIINALDKLTKELTSELGQESSSHSAQEDEWQRLRQTYAHKVDPYFVGMDEEIEILVSKMKDENRQRVVKIYGMGGLGKTTLAREVYNHRDLQSYARAWVCITQQFQPKAVFGEILRQLDSSVGQVDGMEERELVTRIQSFSKGRALVVIDDIWKDDHWEIINQAFPVNCNVTLTPRYENIPNQQSEPHMLTKLGFTSKSFSEDEDIDTERLYLLWMAEGFISYQDKGPNETLRDVAQRYLIELAMRCMVQLHEAEIYSPRDKFDWCKLHDLML
ncbi:probable disease resistance protein At1g58390 [Salvia splendens]|uniref:probable disease resistance protein At1g58390 n=1 Tax=Salvia splendens TaxID=180675 RepID=UPI001C27F746|nr:probable disease resistance protein At1g58390 [Salvia splendens]